MENIAANQAIEAWQVLWQGRNDDGIVGP